MVDLNQTPDISAKLKKEFDFLALYYDGDCPVCSRYSAYQSLHRVSKEVSLKNMRDLEITEFEKIINRGLNPERGLIIIGKKTGSKKEFQLSGRDAFTFLAHQDEAKGLLPNIHRLFKNYEITKIFYPALWLGRWILLAILGKSPSFDKPRDRNHKRII
jgi:hypothetical protein